MSTELPQSYDETGELRGYVWKPGSTWYEVKIEMEDGELLEEPYSELLAAKLFHDNGDYYKRHDRFIYTYSKRVRKRVGTVMRDFGVTLT